ncbi:MAG: bacillithiol transferase BstA [Acidobacteriota bacterium]|nr:bacillithiol transferase BstA [Acidobacteriota bacterium]MDH3529650.1 bacillithiol transferase BstA [Acidobacteriota bacterium]
MNRDLKFPIGSFDLAKAIAERDRAKMIGTIEALPAALSKAVEGLDAEHLDSPYRPGGWTVRQVVHHLADSHINSFCRFKLAMTEDRPTIRAYFEDRWAELPDNSTDISQSLLILTGLHARWSHLLRSMSDTDFEREMDHPESGSWDLNGMLSLYDWHCRHHTAHITSLRDRMGW